MTITFQDFEKSNERLAKEKLSHNPGLEMLQQAAVSQDLLTKDDHWDYYLSLIQSWIEKTEKQKENFRDLSLSPDIVNIDDQQRIKNYYIQCSERLSVLQAVIQIPHQIIKQHEDIKLQLDDFPSDVT